MVQADGWCEVMTGRTYGSENSEAGSQIDAAANVRGSKSFRKMPRWRFIQGVGVLGAASALAVSGRSVMSAANDTSSEVKTGMVPRKPLGKTGKQVSIIGLGGFHLGTIGMQDDILGDFVTA